MAKKEKELSEAETPETPETAQPETQHPGFVKAGDYWHKLNTAGNPMKQRYIEVEGKLCQIN